MKMPKPEGVENIDPQEEGSGLPPADEGQAEIVFEEAPAASNRKKKPDTPEEIERRLHIWDENCRICQAWAKENGFTEKDVFEIIERVRRGKHAEETGENAEAADKESDSD